MAGPTGVLVIQRKGLTVGCGSYHAIDLDAMRTTPFLPLLPLLPFYSLPSFGVQIFATLQKRDPTEPAPERLHPLKREVSPSRGEENRNERHATQRRADHRHPDLSRRRCENEPAQPCDWVANAFVSPFASKHSNHTRVPRLERGSPLRFEVELTVGLLSLVNHL